MAHIVLPESKTDIAKARSRPGYFADTAVLAMFSELDRATASQGRYLVKLVGGAAVLLGSPVNDNMNIGERNLIATKKALWQRGLGVIAEEVGGAQSRSVSLAHGSIHVEISNGGKTIKTI
jgi:chemotaxis protein CheD